MKFKVYFKTPDAIEYAIDELHEDDRDTAKDLCNKFVEYREKVVIEFDTDTGTATVLEVNR